MVAIARAAQVARFRHERNSTRAIAEGIATDHLTVADCRATRGAPFSPLGVVEFAIFRAASATSVDEIGGLGATTGTLAAVGATSTSNVATGAAPFTPLGITPIISLRATGGASFKEVGGFTAGTSALGRASCGLTRTLGGATAATPLRPLGV